MRGELGSLSSLESIWKVVSTCGECGGVGVGVIQWGVGCAGCPTSTRSCCGRSAGRGPGTSRPAKCSGAGFRHQLCMPCQANVASPALRALPPRSHHIRLPCQPLRRELPAQPRSLSLLCGCGNATCAGSRAG
jgi:hypothetical protein